VLTQTHYRFGRAEGTESSHSWLAGASREVFRIPGLTASGDCLLRACVQADAEGATGVALAWEYRHTTEDVNGDPVVGAWTAIPTDTSGPARCVNLGVFADGDNCTKRLAGTGTFTSANAGLVEGFASARSG
jgi:hypothetical protein